MLSFRGPGLRLRRASHRPLSSACPGHNQKLMPSSWSFLLGGGSSYSTCRAFVIAPARVRLNGEIISIAPNHHHPKYFSLRHFSAQNDDFDLPPLDLSTPSLTIPLPPNMIKEKANINGDGIVSDFQLMDPPKTYPGSSKNYGTDFPSLDLTSPAASHGGSFLSQGIQKMKGQMDGRLTSNQRGKLKHALKGKRKKDPTKEANALPSQAWKECLTSIREEIASSMESEIYSPSLIKGSIPKIPAKPSRSTAIEPQSVLSPRSQDLGSFPSPSFDRDLITTQANGTILGHSGSTSVLSTVVLANPTGSSLSSMFPRAQNSSEPTEQQKQVLAQNLLGAIQRANAQSGAISIPLQVDYRERFHASGKIPVNRRRRDNSGPLSDSEVLAARVVDRTVRPWLMMGLSSSSPTSSSPWSLLPENIVVNCEVQSYNPRPFVDEAECGAPQVTQRTHADPTALAVNSTIAALYQSAYSSSNSNLHLPLEPAACVKVAILTDGKVIFDPTPMELDECKLELLYAGTKDRVLMLEFSANRGLPAKKDPGIVESTVADVLQLAHKAIMPIIEKLEELRRKYIKDVDTMALERDESLMTDKEVAQLLGFESPATSFEGPVNDEDGIKILDEANAFVWLKVKHAALKLFGYDGEEKCNRLVQEEKSAGSARVHDGIFLSKKVRGRRENVLRTEVCRLLRDEFMPRDMGLAGWYRSAVREGSSNSECLDALSNHIHESVMKKAMMECTKRHLRADGRRGLNVVRPISALAPILPDSVHGSALFSRGETQVMCTATVGAPREGLPLIDPYSGVCGNKAGKGEERGDDEKIPVGSLRFLRNQAEMESDMNTRKTLAGREMTGDSGILSEVKRMFLHYDFPDFSTGAVNSRVGAAANRRAIGHGNLAEKAILPALPHPDNFPYTVRVTSEVTSSNGSSSMASACGASLALLDAGVPLNAPVAGVSVGLAPGSDELLLDITGTEDHYGDMDFKICGTYGGITAMQLDVKRPLLLETMLDALDRAKEGRRAILNAMENEVPGLHPRPMKNTAPRVEVIKFDPNRKRDLIGPGGAVLRQLEDCFNISLDLSQEGQCLIFGPLSSVSNAKSVIMDLVSDVEEGGIYEGTVIEIKDFGAVIELLRNKEGLLHVSEITDAADKHPGGNIGLVKSHLKVGDKIDVLCTKIDHVQGSIKLSRKKLLSMNQGDNFPIIGGASEYSLAQTRERTNTTAEHLPSLISDTNIAVIEGKDGDGMVATMDDGRSLVMAETDGAKTDSQEIAQWSGKNVEYLEEDGSDDGDIYGNDTDLHENGYGTDGFNNHIDEDGPEDGDGNDYHVDEVGDGERCDEAVTGDLEIEYGTSSLDVRWRESYNQLRLYKREFGHCNVSRRDTERKKLGRWVSRQRATYRKGRLSDDRVQLLDAIGFEWSGLYRLEQKWNQFLNDLELFKSDFGHCNVSSKDVERKQLARWVEGQRAKYRKGCLSDDRVQRLNDIGFEWSRV